jgi:hypothetical protein
LNVREVTADRVTLQLDQVLPPPGQPSAQATERPHVAVEEQARTVNVDGEERSTIALSFQSEALGRLDLRLEVEGAHVRAGVQAPPGRSYDLAAAAAERLQASLHKGTGLDADVRVTARREPLDLYV